MSRILLALALGLAVSLPAIASADIDDWTEVPTFSPSPEHFGLELRLGMYLPTGLGESFSGYFGGDAGPMLSLELHYFPVRIPYLGLIGGGVGLGWSQWDVTAPVAAGAPAGAQGDRNVFEIIPMHLSLVWRIDTFARELRIPLVLTPKVGLDVVHWLTATGTSSDANGWSIGPRFAGKVSLELDFLEPRAARQLDEEWGVNHSEIFFELYYSMAGTGGLVGLPVAGWGWSTGIGLTF